MREEGCERAAGHGPARPAEGEAARLRSIGLRRGAGDLGGWPQRAATPPGTRAVSTVGESAVRFHGILASTAAMAQVSLSAE